MSMIKLNDVHLKFPMMNYVSHSFQRALYNKVGGLLGRDAGDGAYTFVSALRGVSFHLSDGERLGVIGHNGAGKTSLLRLITGVYPPTRGTVEVNGKVNALTNITMGMDRNASGRKNIIFRLIFMGYSFTQAREAVDEIIDFSELGEFIDLPTRTYSTGMFLRLAFAISTHFAPEILVLDEVLAAGDLSFQKKALARIRDLVDKSRVIVLAAHNLKTIREYCTRAIILSQGVVVAEGSPEEMVQQYAQSTNAPKPGPVTGSPAEKAQPTN